MKTTTCIVLIPVDYGSARKACEHIEDETFKTHAEIRTRIFEELGEEIPDAGISIYNITDFMDAVNDEELDVFTEYFMSYVKIVD